LSWRHVAEVTVGGVDREHHAKRDVNIWWVECSDYVV
jgi:hypothetical protein